MCIIKEQEERQKNKTRSVHTQSCQESEEERDNKCLYSKLPRMEKRENKHSYPASTTQEERDYSKSPRNKEHSNSKFAYSKSARKEEQDSEFA